MRRFSMPRLSTLLITGAVAALAVVAIVSSVISSAGQLPTTGSSHLTGAG